jgi:hypothetical protein
MEDVAQWEHELRGESFAAGSIFSLFKSPTELVGEEIPDDLDEEELAAYAAEQELLEGLTADDLFSYSDIDDVSFDDEAPSTPSSKGKQPLYPSNDLDVEMEM